ncbi:MULTISPECIES: RNA polymerase sigma factor [Paenibacillus]|uniref:RNA polymerase sigma factor n=1 Tax=Paenibacillus albilobatus TaxID=2716884 RepID=A0A919XLL0_9BACL|nr:MULTISPECIES: RNA polymerase sigma factor [Paenibacillus]GIO34004.1 RNA polymerase sigma factor [Paenibacillus albilobatus]
MNMNGPADLMIVEDPRLALQGLMGSYAQEVWNFAFFLTKNKEAADDISQEVFIKAYEHWGKFERRSSPKTWLLAITRNLCRNWSKSHGVRKVVLMENIFAQSTASSAENEYLDRLQLQTIWRLVLQLPAKYREVLVLDAHYGLGYAEIAQLLAISEGTVKSRIHRARKRMEKAMEGEFRNET